MDAPCSTRTIRRHLNNETIRHKKRIHSPRLTMKPREKRQGYARQYPTISAKEGQKVVFSNGKKFNLDGPDDFQKYWHTKHFPEGNYSSRHSNYSAFLSEVAVNHLKKARGEVWPKRSEKKKNKKKKHKNYQDEDKKSAMKKKLILRLRSLISKGFPIKTLSDLSIYLSIYLHSVHIYLSIYLNMFLSIYLSISICSYLSINLSISVCIYLSISVCLYLSIYLFLSIYLSQSVPIYLSISICSDLSISICSDLSIYLSQFVSIYLSIYLSQSVPIYLSIYLSICLSFYLSI